MNQAIIRGYYGMRNTGDDAFLTVSAWAAKKYFNVKDIYATAAEIPDNMSNIKPLYYPVKYRGIGRLNRLMELWQSYKNPEWVIWGGGSNFHSADSMEFWLRTLKMSRGTRCFAAGVSIGPFKNKKAEKACANLLRRMDFVGVRDQISYQRAVDIASGARVEQTFDIAPLMHNIVMDMPPSDDRKGLGIAICNYERFVNGDVFKEKERIDIVAKAIKRMATDDYFDEVVLIDFNGHPLLGDSQVHQELKAKIEDVIPVRHIYYSPDATIALKAIGELKGIIAMRMHAAVYGYIANTPTLILGYHEKCFEWAKMIYQPPDLVSNTDTLDCETLIRKIALMITNHNLIPGVELKDALNKSLENWTWINR